MTIDLQQFKPFTLDEVQQVTGCDVKLLEKLTKPMDGTLQLQQGCGVWGLDWLQTFEVFVAWRYIEEGGGMERALWAIHTIAALSLQGLQANHAKGLTFIVPEGAGRHMMVKPPGGRLGKALCTKKLMGEFEARLDKAFPQRTTR